MTIDIEPTVLEKNLVELKEQLLQTHSIKKKLELVTSYSTTKKFLSSYPEVENFFFLFSDREKFVLYSALALGQGEQLFQKKGILKRIQLEQLVHSLIPIEEFYQEFGGVVGYHVMCLELLAQKERKERKGNYHPPNAYDLSEEVPFTLLHTLQGIQHLDQLAEIYPLGGAADRLSINKDEADHFQIAATFEFCEKTLLERLIEDLQAREFLYYKLFGEQIRIPIVIMTSDEKGGTFQIRQMFQEQNWFGRHEEDFFLFSQPLVPAMNRSGQWCVKGECQLLLKPGGHGVIWKLAKESGALEWLQKKGKTKALVRQINNPVASIDYGLLAFIGIGFELDKDFGFAACPCAKKVCEGVNVVIEKEGGKCLTNIEYCDFEHFQIDASGQDLLANTNLLFIDIATIEELLTKCPIPGMLVNAKKIKYRSDHHVIKEEEVMRLESTMQNLADALVENGDPSIEMERSFITTNKREKTISTIKKEFAFGSSMLQTPEQCYLDMLKNGRDLLVNYCNFEVPILRDSMSFFRKGPSFTFLYHPALGPTYQVIAQKLNRGKLGLESELQLEIADLYIENLNVDGSLQIMTDSVMGHRGEQEIVHYSQMTGKCRLKNVSVQNAGINREASRSFWKNEIVHKQRCEIFIEQGGEFYAEDVCFQKDVQIRVPQNVKIVAFMKEGKVHLSEEKLHKPSWSWEYTMNSESKILLRSNCCKP